MTSKGGIRWLDTRDNSILLTVAKIVIQTVVEEGEFKVCCGLVDSCNKHSETHIESTVNLVSSGHQTDQPWVLDIRHHELWIEVLLKYLLIGDGVPTIAIATFGKNLVFYSEVQLTKFAQGLSTCNL